MLLIRTKSRAFLLGAIAAALISQPVLAQFSDSYNFLKAVDERDGAEAEKYLNEPGSVIVNTKRDQTGETALHIVVARKDDTWLNYLLLKGANPNLADRKGVTPLMLATQMGFVEGAARLIKNKASVDGTNRSGETPLIRAVQLRNAEMVRLLLKSGANPDKRDALAGLSAREYAAQDGRNSAILGIIERGVQPEEPKKSGELDFSGIGEQK
ncbi:MAG: ankyrin repeat domain-containing protein [Sphingomonadales bacterium]|jgi:ankyrin repeat protein|nr:ankyrin repeat domain-containing protein [Sphingomonadales bacterium]MBK9002539.1 ankyrin repeat domain-containing protein [Sphingomonadales bacterium]MBK9267759.1 ankyrin repeat domain-containing protein [Sphingomonadales bacterium]MBP6433436.1 ankyrin repeat domain-containing protein [Sphingorhabdus sp.]